MTGPQHRPSPGPRGADDDRARPSPRPRHGFDDHEFPEDSYQGGYPDLRSSRPVERATPTDPEGFGELYGGTGPQPAVGRGGYAAPMRYEGYGAPVPAGGSQPGRDDPGDDGYGAYGRAAHRQPEEPVTPARAAYGEYGDPESRGGTAIDGGPPYPVTAEEDDVAPTAAAPATAYGRDEGSVHGEAGGGTAVAERTALGTGAGAVPAPRPPRSPAGVVRRRWPRPPRPASARPAGPPPRRGTSSPSGPGPRPGPPHRRDRVSRRPGRSPRRTARRPYRPR